MLLSPDGTQVVATFAPDLARAVGDAAPRLAAVEHTAHDVRVPVASGTALFRALRVEGSRPVGWLARVELATDGAADGDDGPADTSDNRRR